MKKILLIPSLVTVGLMPMLSMVGCGQPKQPTEPTSIMLNETNLTLPEGETFELKATIEPEDVVCNLKWSSSDDSVATVDSNGVVTAQAVGDAIITVKAEGFENIKAECTVKVNEYFTVTALEESTFQTYCFFASPKTQLQYCLNDEGWNDVGIKHLFTDPITISQGSTLKLRGDNNRMDVQLLFTGKVVLSGNIMSLIDKSMSTTNIPYVQCFDSLFYVEDGSDFDNYRQSIVSAEELDLPDTDLTGVDNCYQRMFRGCQGLEKAPRLKATILSDECYDEMFYGCTSLKEIKLDYTGKFSDGDGCFTWWVNGGVPNTGTFYYNGTDRTYGASAIPNHWEVVPLV